MQQEVGPLYKEENSSKENDAIHSESLKEEEQEQRERLLTVPTSSDVSPAKKSWRKVKHGVQVTSAMTGAFQTKRRLKKSGGLSRQDSFITRFSTRQQADDTEKGISSGKFAEAEGGHFVRCRNKFVRRVLGVITTDSSSLFYWLVIITAAVLYNLWLCIARECFPDLQKNSQLVWYGLDGLSDFIYVLDVFVQIRTAYLEQGIVVTDAKKLAKRYFKSKYFILDAVSIIPLDVVQFLTSSMHPLLRFPRFLKAYRTVSLYYIIESRSAYPNLWRVINLVHILLLLAHWFAGFYYVISVSEDFVGRWTYPNPVGVFATLRRKYLACLYWSTLTLTTIGDLPPPETNIE